jgi:hypothetical protein
MRFGKNFTFLNIAKQVVSENGNVLVLTNKPGVFSSLKDDIESHVYFDGWKYSELKRNKDWTPSNGVDVLAVSKQLTDNAVSGEAVRETLSKTHFLHKVGVDPDPKCSEIVGAEIYKYTSDDYFEKINIGDSISKPPKSFHFRINNEYEFQLKLERDYMKD